MNKYKCNCKKCRKMNYINKREEYNGFGITVVYCDKFPKGDRKPIYCRDYEKRGKEQC